jgi:ABC-2 type transport system permease protein
MSAMNAMNASTISFPYAPRPRGPLAAALRDSYLVAQRDMAHWVREPQLILWGLLFPIAFVLLFAYVFGSGMIVPGGGSYREFLMPGIFAQTMAFGVGETVASVQADTARGVTDRLRSMPLSPMAVVSGRAIANTVYSCLSLLLLVGCGLAIGWRWHGSFIEAAAGFGLLLWLRIAFLWVGIYLGLKATSPEMANGIYGLLYPVTMLSSAFVSTELMPCWLGTIADWNPISATIAATRELFGNPGAPGGGSWIRAHAIEMALLWPAVITAISLPLAVRAFQRLSR